MIFWFILKKRFSNINYMIDKDRTDEKLHNYIFINKDNRITLVDTKIGGDLKVSKNLNTDTLKASKIGYDHKNKNSPGYAQFLDVSCNNIKVSGNTTLTGTLNVSGDITANKITIDTIVNKTLYDIDITDNLDVHQNLDVRGVFTTHGGISITGVGTNNKIDNVDIGSITPGTAEFTTLTCANIVSSGIQLTNLDNCIIGSTTPVDGSFLELTSSKFTMGNGTESFSEITSTSNKDILIKAIPSNNSIRLNSSANSNIDINVNSSGSINLNKVNILEGTISNTTINSSSITIPSGKQFNIQNGTILMSAAQKLEIMKTAFSNNDADIDIGDFILRCDKVISESIPVNRVVFADTDGLLSSSSGFTYDKITEELIVGNVKGFTLTDSIDFNNQDLTNIRAISGSILNMTINNSEITIPSGNTLDIRFGTILTSNAQDLAIFKNALLVNNGDLDIGNFAIKSGGISLSELTVGRIPFVTNDGFLKDEPGFEYDEFANKLTISKLSGYELDGIIEGNSNTINNISLTNSTINNSSITLAASNTIDISLASLTTSSTQNLAIVKSGLSVNDENIDIGNNDFRASNLSADSIPSSRVLYTGDDGLISSESNFEYNATSNTFKVENVEASGVFSLTTAPNLAVGSSGSTSVLSIAFSKIEIQTQTGSSAPFILPDGSEGQNLIIFFKINGGSIPIITPDNLWGATSFTFNNIGDSITLIFTSGKWLILSKFRTVIS